MNSFYSEKELGEIGLKSFGENVLISRKASFYGVENISVGSHVRIDDFSIITGNITIGSYVHIAAYCGLFGGVSGIVLKDFTTVSSRCAIYADSDDYSGNFLAGPTIPKEYRNVTGGEVLLEKYVQIGTGSTIMPAVKIGEGAAVGSMSLVNKSLDGWGIYIGAPCKRVKARSQKLLELGETLLPKMGEAV